MLYRKFGNTDKKISVLGYGTACIGLSGYLKAFDSKLAQNESIKALEKAIELGINYFDTAPVYANKTPDGEWPTDRMAERLLGQVVPSVKRDTLFIATKNQIGQNDPAQIRRSIEESLRLLNTDYIDLYQIHGANYRESQYSDFVKEETEKELLKLKEEGLIKHIGISGYREGGLLAAAERGIYESVMQQYNIFYRGAEWELLDVIKERKIAFFPMRPVTGERIAELMKELDPENKLQTNPYHVAMKYLLMNELITSVPVGMRTAKEVEDNVKFVNSLEGIISHE